MQRTHRRCLCSGRCPTIRSFRGRPHCRCCVVVDSICCCSRISSATKTFASCRRSNSIRCCRDSSFAVDSEVSPSDRCACDLSRRQLIDDASRERRRCPFDANPAPNSTKTIDDGHDSGSSISALCLQPRKGYSIEFISTSFRFTFKLFTLSDVTGDNSKQNSPKFKYLL